MKKDDQEEKTNKYVLDKLTDYFMKQPKEIVAKSLASAMLDINRWWHIEELDIEEKFNLIFRTEHNMKQISEFTNNNEKVESKPMTYNIVNSS